WIKGYRKSGNEAFIRRRKEKSMTRSDDTHENEANMTPEEMKNAKWHLNRSQFGIRIDHDLASISDHSLASQSITIWHASDH
ncbi:hypothetical protein NXZ34_27020, partial [Escherichia coli]|nr:hypothetical protein [Escherichia coli]MDE7981763.1 hypothetical protein [Escherichia coli]